MARPTLSTHRKFHRLARALGSRLVARGALEILWDFCYEAGTDYVGTSEDVESLIGWEGGTGQLTAALISAGAPEGQGFIELVPGEAVTYRVHDLWHHAPDYVAKRRKRELDRLGRVDPALGRHSAPNGGHCPQTSNCQIEVDDTPARALARAPARAQEKNSPEALPRSEPVSALVTTEPVVMVFPTIGTAGDAWRLRQAQIDEWQGAYPVLDVLSECRKALSWLNANPGRKKTVRGMPKFLNGWLSRAVDAGRVNHANFGGGLGSRTTALAAADEQLLRRHG